ncbi:MAG: signal recognition particle-docking protein FtsY [Desulfatiglandales bacterium]|jgi:fused signal recognition particle receptor|nr:signal recognition particle-docking protein FtsY [Desulfatiglandales bacterium]
MIRFFKKKNKKEDDEEKSLYEKLRRGLSKTRSGLVGRLDHLIFGKEQIDEALLDELEEILFTSDLGVATTQELIDKVQTEVAGEELNNPEKLKSPLKEHIRSFLDVPQVEVTGPGPGEPLVVMVIGVNGAGKTTTIAKVAHHFKEEGQKVLLVAADTFRAAAIEQLSIWGERVGAEVVKQAMGADPSAVVFDAITASLSREIDVVIIDTAGRLHTKSNLMDELKKIQRVAHRKLSNAPHQVWLILDATTGQNAISQAEMFHEAVGVTGIILTKLDGTAKGGIVVGISHQLGLPIKFIGIGEGIDDLQPFNASEFVNALFD